MGRFMSPVDVSAAKHETEVFNSRLKRGEVENADKIRSIRHVVCGCGVIGCIFLSIDRREKHDSL
jgi:hypothetical protein